MVQRVTARVGDADLILETGRIGKQANGCVFAQWGGAAVIATVCASHDAVEGMDYVPVTVDYNEKFYAAGKIPGGFVKREGRPKDKEILVSRLIDRPMRPLFEMAFGREIQIVPTCVSADGVHTQDIIAVIAASAAVTISDIPFHGPVAACRVAYLNGEYVVNPTFAQIEKADLEIVVAGTAEGFTMVEGGANEASEDVMLGALEKAQGFITEMCRLQEELQKLCGKEKLPLAPLSVTLANAEAIEAEATPLMKEACFRDGKAERSAAVKAVKNKIAEKYAEQLEDEIQLKLFNALFEEMEYNILRTNILDKGLRVDGRGTKDIRPITCEIGVLPRPHGSAVFTRGETQSLGVVTIGTVFDEQIYDDIEGDRRENFILHYNFPPFSTGEAKAQRGVGRREIGHGHLAWRGLKGQIPADYPYTVRVVSQILESNGSSSMATVCAGTLALMDAGVPLKKPVSGIAMGLIKNPGEEKYAILSDILGDEDHLGDMDFKTTGTKDGLTATQMDIKCDGLSFEILEKALMQAKAGREHILGKLTETIAEPRPELKPQVPRIVQIEIPKEFIGAVIGPGGKIIQQMQEDTGTTITIDEVDGKGKVQVSAPDKASIDAALSKIRAIVAVPEVGEVYEGTVRSVMPYGCFVEIMPGKDGLLHISEIDWKRLETVEEAGIKEGDKMQVKLLDIDPKTGKYKLSRRVLMEKPEGYVERERRPRGDRPERGERRGRRDDRHDRHDRD